MTEKKMTVSVSDTKAVMCEFGDEILIRIKDIIESGQLASGQVVSEAEQLFASTLGVNYASMVNNGTTALVGALKAEGIKPGDEVILPAFSFNATLNAVLSVGATAVLADIDPKTFTLSPEETDKLITSKTRAIMPVHIFGQPAEMGPLMEISRNNDLVVIEDAAQAHGAIDEGEPVGGFGTAGFSCYPTKNISAPEAGFVTTNDKEKKDYVDAWRNQGMGKKRYQYEIADGTNARSNNIAAAFIIPQIENLRTNISLRQKNALDLNDRLVEVRGLNVPACRQNITHAWHQYTVKINPAIADISRDDLHDILATEGISTGIYYPRMMSDYPVYDEYIKTERIRHGSLMAARKVVQEVISLPVHPYVSTEDVNYISSAIQKVLG